MTIIVHPNRQKVPVANFVKNLRRKNEYDDEYEINQSFSSERICTDDSHEKKGGLYALEVIPKAGTLSQVDQGVQREMTNQLHMC
jgi:hypothetical protein